MGYLQTTFPWRQPVAIFLAQEGQLRLGLGGWVCAAVASTTAWNTRAESFVVGSIMVAIVVAALYLKLRLFGKLTFWDSIILLIVLSTTQMDVPTVVPFTESVNSPAQQSISQKRHPSTSPVAYDMEPGSLITSVKFRLQKPGWSSFRMFSPYGNRLMTDYYTQVQEKYDSAIRDLRKGHLQNDRG